MADQAKHRRSPAGLQSTAPPFRDGFRSAPQAVQYIAGDQVRDVGIVIAKQLLGVHQTAAEVAQADRR